MASRNHDDDEDGFMDTIEVRPILESLLFVSENPLRLDTLAEILPEWSKETLREALQQIQIDCSEDCRGVELVEVAGGYQFRTKPRWVEWINRLKKAKPSKLSRSALETLAIIAYRQPVIRPEIDQIRGVDSGWVIRSLMEKGLVRIVGRKEIPGRPILYGTTKAFLELFGLNSLSDLPPLKEVEPPAEIPQEEMARIRKGGGRKPAVTEEASEIAEVLEEIEKDRDEGEIPSPLGKDEGERYRQALEGLQRSEPDQNPPERIGTEQEVPAAVGSDATEKSAGEGEG